MMYFLHRLSDQFGGFNVFFYVTFRAVAAECLTGNKKSSTLASLDKSIKEMETAIEGTCK